MPELVGRLRAGPEHLGFRVELGPTAATPLEAQARAAGVDAALRVTPDRRGVAVWALNPESRASALREVVLPVGEADPGVVAVRAVELVRAAFLEIAVELPAPGEPHPTSDAGGPGDGGESKGSKGVGADAAPVIPYPSLPTAAPRVAPDGLPPARRANADRLAWAGAGPELLVSGGEVPATAEGVVTFGLRLGDQAALGATLGWGLTGGRLRGAEGTAGARGHLGGVELVHRRGLAEAGALRAGVGAAALWLRVTGDATAPWESREDSTIAALPYAVIGGELWPWASLGFAADVRAGCRCRIRCSASGSDGSGDGVPLWSWRAPRSWRGSGHEPATCAVALGRAGPDRGWTRPRRGRRPRRDDGRAPLGRRRRGRRRGDRRDGGLSPPTCPLARRATRTPRRAPTPRSTRATPATPPPTPRSTRATPATPPPTAARTVPGPTPATRGEPGLRGHVRAGGADGRRRRPGLGAQRHGDGDVDGRGDAGGRPRRPVHAERGRRGIRVPYLRLRVGVRADRRAAGRPRLRASGSSPPPRAGAARCTTATSSSPPARCTWAICGWRPAPSRGPPPASCRSEAILGGPSTTS